MENPNLTYLTPSATGPGSVLADTVRSQQRYAPHKMKTGTRRRPESAEQAFRADDSATDPEVS